MKRFLVIPIMFLYILAVSGIMIHVHYCSKTIESWSFFSSSDRCNDTECDDVVKPDNCCKDKVISAKVVQDQHLTQTIKLLTSSWATVNTINHFISHTTAIFSDPRQTLSNQSNAPPGPWQNIPLYKLHARFTYYG
ncbi:MAG TPA: hypothetical protein VL093_14325 [Flavipsychrobacter sp.]|nr:hypothetical protein [Flavipsychrobacter sp.]